jgi:hypothetical protein
VTAARETAIDIKAAGSFVTSLILPVASFLVGYLKLLVTWSGRRVWAVGLPLAQVVILSVIVVR